jgi:hypothetical protein
MDRRLLKPVKVIVWMDGRIPFLLNKQLIIEFKGLTEKSIRIFFVKS